MRVRKDIVRQGPAERGHRSWQRSEKAWAHFLVVFGVLLGLSILNILAPDVRLVASWAFLAVCLTLVFLGPGRYAAAIVLNCLMVHGWLSKSTGLDSIGIAGLNAGTITTVVGLAAYFIRVQRWPNFPTSARPVAKLFLLFVLVDFTVAVRGYGFQDETLFTVLGGYGRILCILLWVGWVASAFPREEALVVASSFLIGPFLVGLSVFQSVLESKPLTMEELALARSSGLLDPNFALVGLGLALLLALLQLRQRGLRATRVLAGFIFFSGLLFTIYAGSRTAALALVGSFGVMALVSGRKTVLFALGLGGLLVVFSWSYLPASLQERYTGAAESYSETRVPPFNNARDAFLRAPLFGSGRDTYRLGSLSTTDLGAHNTLLAFLAEGGLVYGGTYVIVLAVFWIIALRRYRATRDEIWLFVLSLVSLFVIAGNGLVLGVSDYCSTIFIGIAALTVGVVERNVSTPAPSRRSTP